MEKEGILDISWQSIFKIFFAVLVIYIVFVAKDIALWIFFAFVLSILLDPAIYFLRRLYVPKILAVIIVYFAIFGVLGLVIYLAAPILISELQQFSHYLPGYFERISPFLKQMGMDTAQNFNDFTQSVTMLLQQSSKGIINAVLIFFGGLASTASILIMAFFLSLEERGAEKLLLILSPKKYEDQIKTIFERAQRKVTGWFGARILACLFVGLASYIVFYIFGVKYALILALIAGIFNFIPYIGPVVTGILLLIFIAVSDSLMTGFYVLIAFTVIQSVEGGLLTPLLMKKMVDVPPILVLISLFIGARFFGVLGMIFAIPMFGIIFEFLKEFLERKRESAI